MEPVQGFVQERRGIIEPEDLDAVTRRKTFMNSRQCHEPAGRTLGQAKLPLGAAEAQQQLVHIAPPPAQAGADRISRRVGRRRVPRRTR